MILAYKAFNPDMTCRDFQYKCGRWYEQYEPAKLCKKGFHACILPQHVFCYYPSFSKFAKVLLDDIDTNVNVMDFSRDSKICGRQIYIFPYTLTLNEMIKENATVLNILLRIEGCEERTNHILSYFSDDLTALDSISDPNSRLARIMWFNITRKWFNITRNLCLDKSDNEKITVKDLLKRIEEEQRKAGLF